MDIPRLVIGCQCYSIYLPLLSPGNITEYSSVGVQVGVQVDQAMQPLPWRTNIIRLESTALTRLNIGSDYRREDDLSVPPTSVRSPLQQLCAEESIFLTRFCVYKPAQFTL